MTREHDTDTHLQHTTLSTTLASEYADLRQVYLGRRRSYGGKDILELVDNRNNFRP